MKDAVPESRLTGHQQYDLARGFLDLEEQLEAAQTEVREWREDAELKQSQEFASLRAALERARYRIEMELTGKVRHAIADEISAALRASNPAKERS